MRKARKTRPLELALTLFSAQPTVDRMSPHSPHTATFPETSEETLSHSNSGLLESEDSFDRPVAPGQQDENDFQRASSFCASDASDVDERVSLGSELSIYREADGVVIQRAMDQLKEIEELNFERLRRLKEEAIRQGLLQSEPDQQEGTSKVSGSKLSGGRARLLGPNGTWVDDGRRGPSTNELPSVREDKEKLEEVPNTWPFKSVSEEDLSGMDPRLSGRLTPVTESFVPWDGFDSRM